MDFDEDVSKSLCAYFEDLNDTLKQFKLGLTESDAKHSLIVSMRKISENLRELLANGELKPLPPELLWE